MTSRVRDDIEITCELYYASPYTLQPRPSNGSFNLCEMASRTTAGTNWSELALHGVRPTGEEIGRGAYGRVFEVDYGGTVCAAKEVHEILLQYAQGGEHSKITEDFLRECQIWSTLRHPCIVQFLGRCMFFLFFCLGVCSLAASASLHRELFVLFCFVCLLLLID